MRGLGGVGWSFFVFSLPEPKGLPGGHPLGGDLSEVRFSAGARFSADARFSGLLSFASGIMCVSRESNGPFRYSRAGRERVVEERW